VRFGLNLVGPFRAATEADVLVATLSRHHNEKCHMYRAARRFAGLAGPTLSIAARARQDTGPSRRVAQIGYTRREVGDGVYVFEADFEYGALVSGNSTLIIGDGAALVVDSRHYPEVTRRMVAEIESITPKPVKFRLNTHCVREPFRAK
jgi:hypothetical protein